MATTEHRAGDVLQELLMCGVLTSDDIASALRTDAPDVDVEVRGDVVLVTTA